MSRPFLTQISAGAGIINLPAPSGGNDAVRKSYADSLIAGGTKWLNPVRCLMDSDVPDLAEFDTTIDDVTLADGDRVALVGQTDPIENGIYVWADATNAFTRAADLPAAANAAAAAFFVEEGTNYAEQCWRCTDDQGADVVGTDPLTFTQFGAGFTPTTAFPVNLSGNEIQLLYNTMQFGVNGSNELEINAGGIDNTLIADGNLEQAKFAFPVAQMHGVGIIGDAVETAFVVTHNLNTTDVIVQVLDPDDNYKNVECDITRTSNTEVTITFLVAPANGKVYRVVCVGNYTI